VISGSPRVFIMPPRIHEMLHEVPDAACSAADVPLEARTMTPSATPVPSSRHVGIGDTQDAVLDEVGDFPIERGLKSVRTCPAAPPQWIAFLPMPA